MIFSELLLDHPSNNHWLPLKEGSSWRWSVNREKNMKIISNVKSRRLRTSK
jgi:hypothetical protein